MAVDLNNPDLNALMQALKRQGFTDAQAGSIAGIDPSQRQQAYDVYVNQTIPQMGATDIAQFQAQRDQLKDSYQQQRAAMDYQQGIADQNYGTQRTTLLRQFDQMRERLPYRYNARGVMNSGIYSQGLQDYANDRVRQINNFELGRQQQQGGFALQRNQLENQYQSGLSGVDQLEKARRAQVAAQIKAVQ